MGPARFSVSVKGVLEVGGRYLLRKNQRKEYELLGGRLEGSDLSCRSRLAREFWEESKIPVRVGALQIPWLYRVGKRQIVIVPYLCDALDIPTQLRDDDGGSLHWVPREELDSAPLPQGYRDTLLGVPPRDCSSPDVGSYFIRDPNYTEYKYNIIFQFFDGGRVQKESHLQPGLGLAETLNHLAGGQVLRPKAVQWNRDRTGLLLQYEM